MSFVRSIAAVLAGIAVLTLASFAIEAAANPLILRMFHDAIPDEQALNQNVWAKLFMLAYTMFSVALGGYVTSWLAPRMKVNHAIILGLIETAMTVWVLTRFAAHAPLWSSIAGTVSIIPSAWYGGVLWVRRVNTAATGTRAASA